MSVIAGGGAAGIGRARELSDLSPVKTKTEFRSPYSISFLVRLYQAEQGGLGLFHTGGEDRLANLLARGQQ